MQPFLRDTRKLKDKLELTIDPRQIALVVIGEVLLLILVFILGFAVGKSRHAQQKPVLALQEPLVQGEILAQTFEQSQSQTQEQVVETQEPVQETELQLQLPQEQIEETSGDQKVYQLDLTEQKDSAPQQSPQLSIPEPSPTTKQKEQSLIVEIPSSEEIEKPKEKREEQKPLIIPSQPEPTGFSNTVPSRYYTVQVAAFDTKEQASAYVDKLKQKYSLDAYITEGKVQGKTWYRVRVGKFEDLQKAKDFAKVLEERLTVKPFIDLTSE